MRLDANGYSDQFKNFVHFADHEITTGNGRDAVASLSGNNALGEHTISANNHDKIGKFSRSQEMKDSNNAIRTLFKKTIADMFGGENNIPKSVLNAMKLEDYGKGKPLSARRILAVKQAIDLDGTAKLQVFRSADAATAALGKGWTQAELPKIARAAHFLSQATGVDEFTAIEQLSTPGSKANRLMHYGGRFMDSAANFANGLRLMDSFASWFQDIYFTMKPVFAQKNRERDYTPADTFTKLNIDSLLAQKEYLKGLEKFAFEELSVNPKANLAETDMEKLFGFKNNKAMNFFGRGFGSSFYSTLDSIPKEKRAVIYTAVNAFTESAQNAREAHDKNLDVDSVTWIRKDIVPTVIARLLKNFDRAESLYAQGKLTAKNIINEFFAEIPDKGDLDYETINSYFDDITDRVNLGKVEGGQTVFLMMENSGCTFDETVQALREGRALPIPRYLSTGTVSLNDMDGTSNGGRKLIENDLDRPDFCYHFNDDPDTPLLDPGKGGFGFTFPNEDKFYTNGSQEGLANIQRVGDKVMSMCGQVHVSQANSVMMMLSQSGLTNLRAGLGQVGTTSNEHAPVDYTLSKNEETGDISIRYSSPEALPFKFEWTATVDVNGTVTTTPMTIEKKRLDPQLVSSALDTAVSRMNVTLTEAQKARAREIVGELGRMYNLEGKKLALFANFVVNLQLTDTNAESDTRYARDMAKTISKWTEFEIGKGGESGVSNVETTIKNLFNEIIDDALDDSTKGAQSHYFKNDPDISLAMQKDADRMTYIFNGKQASRNKKAVIDTFKDLITDTPRQRALSQLLSQISPMIFSSLSMRGSLTRTRAHPDLSTADLPGIEKIVSRDMAKGRYEAPTITNSSQQLISLDVKEDDTATLTFEKKNNGLMTGTGTNISSAYGSVSFTCVLQIDLKGEKPVVTDAQLAQSFDVK